MIRKEEVAGRLRLNAELACSALEHFLRDGVEQAGAAGLVTGLSGGVDSALAAALAVRALGAERVHALFLPYRESDPQSRIDAEAVAAKLGLALRTIDLTPQIDAYFDAHEPDADRTRRGNKLARERMTILYDQAKKLDGLVLGTSNKTEILLGYSTVFGDNASSLNPNGDLWKCQVWQLAEHLGIPKSVLGKEPSADLWPGQTSAGELGFDYRIADEVLYLMFELGLLPGEIVERGYPADIVAEIVRRERQNRFKRRLMLIARLESVIGKEPSADLWPGQTSAGELGFDYRIADEVLYLMFELSLLPEEIVARGYAADVVAAIVRRERNNRFKRRLMLIARLSNSAVNLDREIPRD
jgi:NAD+ synthase